ncbi:hypothetical protein BDN72DRAFT_844737 [Pluteus cervinus]|uniref:Uncharacterized protein n=1 Tax=Pluteus cervinus TaxID=181527 RepID=A0ACD3AKV4_9AGAR|nr:hypothetical protein BDN72DRAFT_844737 [Pluteus cervinus]
MTSTIVSPRLPPELEYTIFLLAFGNDPLEAKCLALIAKRVFDWLIPHIFRVVKLSVIAPLPIKFNEETYKKHGHHVRHLMLETVVLAGYLHLFPNVVNLAYWVTYNPRDLPFILQLPLTCISMRPTLDLFQVFAKVTHLDLWATIDPRSSEIRSALYFPKLTHLCVTTILEEAALRLFCERERCPELEVLVIWAYQDSEVMLNDEPPTVDDQRVVMIQCHAGRDWEQGARGGLDMWGFAEQVLEARKVLGGDGE